MAIKDYLSSENARNKKYAAVYERLMRRALGTESVKLDVLIGRHLCFEVNGDLSTENEIPSADCLLFDHDIMDKVFKDAHAIMARMAVLTPGEREAFLEMKLDWLDAKEALKV